MRCYLVEPATAPALAGGPVTNPSHKIQGGGYNRTHLPLLDRTLVEDYLSVTDDEAIAAARLLAAEEGIFGGFSSGAHLAVALRLLEQRERGATIVFLICDSGLKYLSTDLFSEPPARMSLLRAWRAPCGLQPQVSMPADTRAIGRLAQSAKVPDGA